MEELLTSKELSELWGTTQAEIREFAKMGMPHIKRKKSYFFNLAECQKWYRQDAW